MDIINEISRNLQDVQQKIVAAAEGSGRKGDDVTLIAVGKAHEAARSHAALRAGQRAFGENRVQEAAGKWPPLRAEFNDVEVHLIGPLQTNKVRQAMTLFDVIQTVDRPKLAAALAQEAEKLGRCPACFIQVNTGAEPQKAGIMPQDADKFIADCIDIVGLPVEGLMCIPPADEEPSLHFAMLREIAKRHGLTKLSMGMSADYEIAVAFGATHVRVGTAIFGQRPPLR